ncbi:erythromycin esterase family protein [Methylocystis sp. MJC1]|jgi:erythromycin esterase-like protein|uniref:erythromycin esterase family protein n=1 Tax=Methylocystis sp. MJC1 TaxID=2654282 RepID=UPI0020A66307|nr:erythromycin esterase family protein [Methylocystis sp. MJC1]KAF2989193.1 hypothetical protein MJC1_03663 [Methylocystis sp. MJC1]UZX13358.1 erythromycin esterase family protein [Methylocystis sp. MJC1]
MPDMKAISLDRESVRNAITRALTGESEPLPAPERVEEFGRCFARFADAQVVLLGEATHGTSEFYLARAAITRELVARHGFSFVAVEADWPDAARIDRYVRGLAAKADAAEAFTRFPTWMWRNREVMDFLDWLRSHNARLAPERRVSFHGLDVYSLSASIDEVVRYLDRVDPEAAKRARGLYACLTPWQDEPADYGRAVLRGYQKPCEDEAAAQLTALLSKRLAISKKMAKLSSMPLRTRGCSSRRAILSGDVSGRARILEFARPAYVRHPAGAARSPRARDEGGRLGA